MKAITGYAAILCVSLIMAGVAVKGTTAHAAEQKSSTLKANIEARKAALDAAMES